MTGRWAGSRSGSRGCCEARTGFAYSAPPRSDNSSTRAARRGRQSPPRDGSHPAPSESASLVIADPAEAAESTAGESPSIVNLAYPRASLPDPGGMGAAGGLQPAAMRSSTGAGIRLQRRVGRSRFDVGRVSGRRRDYRWRVTRISAAPIHRRRSRDWIIRRPAPGRAAENAAFALVRSP
jgi:hypothetical protein